MESNHLKNRSHQNIPDFRACVVVNKISKNESNFQSTGITSYRYWNVSDALLEIRTS